MTEEKRQSTVQPEQIQGFNSPAEDEINLIDLLKLMARKKILFLTVTSFCTLFSIFYAQSITPLYRAKVGIIDHKERFSSLSILEQLDPKIADKIGNQTREPFTVFERFLFNIRSYKFKQEVFVKGGFQKKFSHETGIDTDQSASEIYSSIKIIPREELDYGVFTQLQLEGSKPKVMLEFLTELVEAAKENAITEINETQRSSVKTRINKLSEQIEELHQKFTLQKQIEKIKKQREKIKKQREKEKKAIQKQIEKEKKAIQKQIEKEKKAAERTKEIVRLSKALDMAKRMGIKNNNFDKPNNGSAPVWFRYGELLLQEKIKILRSKEETPNNKNLAIEKNKLQSYKQKITSLVSKEKEISNTNKLAIEKLKLERSRTADLPLLKFKVTTIIKHTYNLVKPYQPGLIVGFGLAFGLFISIFVAYIIHLKQLKSKEIHSASI